MAEAENLRLEREEEAADKARAEEEGLEEPLDTTATGAREQDKNDEMEEGLEEPLDECARELLPGSIENYLCKKKELDLPY